MTFSKLRQERHSIVMILCFVYGGVSLLFFLMQLSPLFRSSELRPLFMDRINLTDTGRSEFLIRNNSEVVGRGGNFEGRVKSFVYVLLGISLSGSIISILGGLSLMNLLKKKERQLVRSSMMDSLTTPDEKKILSTLGDVGGELTQSELVQRSGLTKVKIHRVVKRLEELKLIEKYPYGMTNKIRVVEQHQDAPADSDSPEKDT